MYVHFIKPLLDKVLAFILLLILMPIMLLTMVLLLMANKGSIFFLQNRPGKNERIFKIIKFKTMNDRVGPDGHLLPDAERLSRVGRFIRSFSIDELPQIINVLKGDMSFIGPRPLLIEYLPLYSSDQRRRHEAKPGISGWAQINGRNALSWEDKFKLDVWYVDHVSFCTDFKIFWLSIYNILKRKGIKSSSSATMEKFTGKQ